MKFWIVVSIFCVSVFGCSPIQKKNLGVNAFVNDPSFGTISEQFQEVQQTLGLQYVRVLFNWNDQVQPTPTAQPQFDFYDSILASLPPGMDALVIVNGLPSWMSDPTNWSNNDPRATFVELWVKTVVDRYSSNTQIVGWEIWNEPNDDGNPENLTLAMDWKNADGASNYVAMLSSAYDVVKAKMPSALVVAAATTSINQNYPNTLNYGKAMKSAGAEAVCDVWGVHYYGTEYDHIFAPNGIEPFINSLSKPIWLTESGAKGVTAQLDYVDETWEILETSFKNLERIYYYQFTEATPPDTTYGLRNLGPGEEYSDLYNYLASH
ncbi:MAG: cellulase family glycosylhydrolase [Bdellovibrionales bacterium]|nr:cellulase family glycosylhydrolase [Bdellovibrionales bacterium]